MSVQSFEQATNDLGQEAINTDAIVDWLITFAEFIGAIIITGSFILLAVGLTPDLPASV